MHIIKPNEQFLDVERLRSDLEAFINQPGSSEAPPCPGCTNHVPISCSAKCPDAPKALSIEPERYPVEPKVVPLVYELMSTHVLMTCWSCEGHMGAGGKLWKVPMVSFYSASAIYPKLLLKHIETLTYKKVLKYRWQVVLSDFAQTLGVTYSIQPELSLVVDVHLGQLQQDLGIIADDALLKMKAIAKEMLVDLSKSSPQAS